MGLLRHTSFGLTVHNIGRTGGPIYSIDVTPAVSQPWQTTIRVSEETQAKLIQLTAELQAKLGRRVSYDEAIIILIEQSKGVQEARAKCLGLFGTLRVDKTAWKDFRRLRAEENKRLEILGQSS